MDNARLEMHLWNRRNALYMQAWMVQYCPPSGAVSRPNLVKLQQPLLTHVASLKTKLVQHFLSPCWLECFFGTFHENYQAFEKICHGKQTCERFTALIMLFQLVSQSCKGLTSHPTRNELCTGCCTVHCMDSAGAGHVALNYRNICLGAEPFAKIRVVIIVACRINVTLAESHSHCSNPCTRLNHSQLFREIWVLPLEKIRPIWKFQPDFATNGLLLKIEDCWTKS